MSDEDIVESGSQGSGSGGGFNPAWDEALAFIPEENRNEAAEVFRKWDSNFQSGVQKVHSEYEPWKPFQEEGLSPDDVRMAMNVVNAIQENPQAVYEQLGQAYGFGASNNNDAPIVNPAQNLGQGGSGQGANNPGNNLNLPPEIRSELDLLKKNSDTMAQIILQKRQEEEAAAEQQKRDEEIQTQLSQLKEKHGNFDEGYVLTQMLNGYSPDQAVQAYQQLVDKIVSENNKPRPPAILTSGNASGLPGDNRINPGKMSSQEVNQYVSKYLAQAQAAQG